MNTTPTTPNPQPQHDEHELALDRLRTTHQLARLAREQAQQAIAGLAGGRRTRCVELTEKLDDVIAFAQRLAFVVEGDLRAGDGHDNN